MKVTSNIIIVHMKNTTNHSLPGPLIEKECELRLVWLIEMGTEMSL